MRTEQAAKKNTGKKTRPSNSRALSTRFTQDEIPDRTYFLRNTLYEIGDFISSRTSELYNAITMAFSLDTVDFSYLRKYVWPAITSGATLVIGDYITRGLSQYYNDNEESAYVYQFLLSAAVLSYCALHRITEREFKSTVAFSAAVASEVMAITYLYSSVFTGTQVLLEDRLSDDYSLIASLGTSALLVPSSVTWLTQKLQEQLVRYQYGKGAQRSDTAAISSGLTPVSNLYYQINHFLTKELMVLSRTFQLGLISDNILHAQKIVQQFRNLPALIADVAPSTIKKMQAQQEKLRQDYEYNNTCHQVLRFTPEGPVFIAIPRYQLRTGDLVLCDDSIDLSSVPVSGEIIALQRDEKGHYIEKTEQQKFSVNLKAQNGEDVWIEHNTKSTFDSNYQKVDLHAVRDGKQAGVLTGDKLNLFGKDNIFIQIKPENELLLNSGYEKTSVIDQIISKRKQKSVLHSILASVIMAAFLQRDITTLPAESIRLMFTLFQTMIPFSEAFLRETINSRLMKKMNSNMEGHPLETVDALRVVDLCNAIGGYYHDRFPQGVAIISDKTGTLTTNTMEVRGLWAAGMDADVQQVLQNKPELFLPESQEQQLAFELFIGAYTNKPKDMEPEEAAILQLFKGLQKNADCVDITTLGNNHFKKIITGQNRELETFHLGLYRTFGGRFTLVKEAENQYLVFCGVPKADSFHDTALLKAYTSMQSRTGVLSRDWCIARAPISEKTYETLKGLFDKDDKKEIESFILTHPELTNNLRHCVTFIIDNPVKKGAEKFISQLQEIQVPVFVATGDTTKAAENIARVLCPEHAGKILSIRANQISGLNPELLNEQNCPPGSTVIFSGINPEVLKLFQSLLQREKKNRPVIIFAEMSTEGKGTLARFLKDNQFFVVANGDGSNDVMMMKHANMVIAHQTEDATFAPGVAPLSNLSDAQLRHLFGSEKSFYELFDINLPKSLFVQQFTPLANSQEKPTMALALKSGKLSFELAKAVGATEVKEMYQQHWFSVAFDLLWLWISFYEINQSRDLPMDNRNIGVSDLITQSMAIVLVVAGLQAMANYALAEESTNLTTMIIMLTILPLVLRSVFSGFRMVQDRLYPAPVAEPVHREEVAHRSVFGYLGTLFRPARASTRVEEIEELSPEPH
ncbi:HAD family hydrolase [Legionella shakespearei]|uniref:Calcium-transporting ATPase n=1 Tax=Legionella shakespearei DSM 23087 TaxID=1122169 RepID=A0A0W0YKX8_9GAMM|nr:HAD family hydrolase [Legionella shakespearei]KTD57580.1 calcium-transporting ATPase [Legionella shakespearei DSM 23087]